SQVHCFPVQACRRLHVEKPPEERDPVNSDAPQALNPLDTGSKAVASHREGEEETRASTACQTFQQVVDEYLVRHRSVLDVLSKCQESAARVNRAVVKAVTMCGCVQIEAAAQQFPADASLLELRQHMDSHLRGTLCEHCRDVLDTELGRALFYLAA